MRSLVATDSAATTTAACDYLRPRMDTGDEVWLLAVVEPGTSVDPDAALDAAPATIGGATVTTRQGEGMPEEHVRALLADREFDELLIGRHRSGADAGLGGTATALIVETPVPVVVLPEPAASSN